MRNYKILIQYDGTNYHGWQVQPNGHTIQGELTRVLSLLNKNPVTVHGAGRTDAGVHAEGQVANFLLERQFQPEQLRDAMNGNLDRDIRIVGVELAAPDFHARFSAKEKTYRYRIFTGTVISPFEYRFVLHQRGRLNVQAMRDAATPLIGTHDFSSFTVADSEVEHHIRTVKRVELQEDGDEIRAFVTADGFLRYMVRNIVGTLVEVGRGYRQADEMGDILLCGDRKRAGVTAKPHGLTLLKIDY